MIDLLNLFLINPRKWINRTYAQLWNAFKYKIYKFDNPYVRHRPLQLTILITSRCTLKCLMCKLYRPFKRINFEDLTLNRFDQILNKFRQALSVFLTGGEPLLNKEVFKMINLAHKYRMTVAMSTNGTVMGELIDKIVSSPLSRLNVSLNACNSHEYRRMQGGSKRLFNTVIENIKDLAERRNKKAKKLWLQVSYICTKSNYKSMPNMVKLAEDLGVDAMYFNNLSPGLPGFGKDECLYADDEDVLEVMEILDIIKSKVVICKPRLYNQKTTPRLCKMPFTNLTLDADGNVSVCCSFLPERRWGNIFHDKDVWNGYAFRKIRRMLIDDSLPIPDICKRCPDGPGRTICR